jgi:hypothetical protein
MATPEKPFIPLRTGVGDFQMGSKHRPSREIRDLQKDVMRLALARRKEIAQR